MNGSGKTTFIKLLCRFYDPTEGEIFMNDLISENMPNQIPEPRRDQPFINSSAIFMTRSYSDMG